MLKWQEIIVRIYELYGVKTQISLAKCLGVTRSLVSRWHLEDPDARRIPTWETMAKVVQDKGVTWDWLLEGREPKYREPDSAL
jgi:transcriptional regulator with XRE-family HTH domain